MVFGIRRKAARKPARRTSRRTTKKKVTRKTKRKPVRKAARRTSRRTTKRTSKKSSGGKKKPFGGYSISFAGRKETLEQVFGKGGVTPSEMTKKIWVFVKKNKLSNR